VSSEQVIRSQRTSSPEKRYCYIKASIFDRASDCFLSFKPVELALMKNGIIPRFPFALIAVFYQIVARISKRIRMSSMNLA
jgi:hypothetical protein